jgi:hypothetical protein
MGENHEDKQTEEDHEEKDHKEGDDKAKRRSITRTNADNNHR